MYNLYQNREVHHHYLYEKDNFNKHARWKCATRAMPKEGVLKGEWYRDRQNKHFRKEKLYASLGIAHRTNLVVQAMSRTYVVARTEVLVQKIHEYFSKSSKKHLDFTKLADIMETKGRKILKHVRTRWLSLLLPAQRVVSEYQTLVMKMELDNAKETNSKALRASLTDVETLLGLACLVPLMEVVDCMM